MGNRASRFCGNELADTTQPHGMRLGSYSSILIMTIFARRHCAFPGCLNSRHVCAFGLAVRAVEAWLLADTERIAAFLRIARGRVPGDPETLDNPKATMVALTRASRRKDVREDMVPRDGSGRPIGPAYSSRLIEFISYSWRPEVAAERADSLRRAIDCLKCLAEPC